MEKGRHPVCLDPASLYSVLLPAHLHREYSEPEASLSCIVKRNTYFVLAHPVLALDDARALSEELRVLLFQFERDALSKDNTAKQFSKVPFPCKAEAVPDAGDYTYGASQTHFLSLKF